MNKITLQLLILLVFVALVGCSKDGDESVINTAPESYSQEFFVDENIEKESSVGFILASDQENDNLTYQLLDVNVPFAVDAITGEIMVSDKIDFEAKENYEFVVVVNDGELSVQTTITVLVNDIPESSLSEEEQLRLLELANYVIFDKGDTVPNVKVRKWKTVINIYLTGDYTAEEVLVVDDFIEQLNGLNVPNLQLNRVDSLEASNVEIWFASVYELINIRPSFAPFINDPATTFTGVARPSFFSSSAEIFKGTIWVKSGRDNSGGTIMHEIVHMLGFGHSDDEESLIFPKNNMDKNLSPDDTFLIKAMYSEYIQSGLNEEELETALKAYFLTI